MLATGRAVCDYKNYPIFVTEYDAMKWTEVLYETWIYFAVAALACIVAAVRGVM